MAYAANLASLVTVLPKIEAMAGLAERAGLFQAKLLMDHLSGKTDLVRQEYSKALNERERAQAAEFCEKSYSGSTRPMGAAPRG